MLQPMPSRYRLITLLVMSVCLVPMYSQENQKNILVLFSYHDDLPFVENFRNGLNQGREDYGNNLNLFVENMDTARLSRTLSNEEWAVYLKNKYRSVRFDAVIAESGRASTLANDHLDLPAEIPRALYSDLPLEPRPNTFYLQSQSRKAVTETLKLAMLQNPGCREVLIIDGGLAQNEEIIKELRRGLEKYKELKTTVLRVGIKEDFIQTVSEIPPGTVVFYTLVFGDITGRQFVPKEVLEELTAASRVPVYSFWNSLMGSGMVGGVVVDGETTGRELVHAVEDYMRDGRFQPGYSTLKSVLDWKTLRRFQIPVPRSGYELINQPVPFFVQNFRQVITALLILFSVFSVIALLWIGSVSEAHRKLQEATAEIESARQKAENLSMRDPLTGMLNRRAATAIINYEMNRKKRLHNTVSLMILDIDHFKAVNDNFGHEEGDRVLEEISRSLPGICRSTDTLSRWGGEEFLILTPDTNGEQAFHLAEKIRKHMADLDFHRCGSITVSLGISELGEGEDFQSWFNRADVALYKAKNEGRNRSVLDKS